MNKIENSKLVFEITPCKLGIAFIFIHKRAKILPAGQHPGHECSFSRTSIKKQCPLRSNSAYTVAVFWKVISHSHTHLRFKVVKSSFMSRRRKLNDFAVYWLLCQTISVYILLLFFHMYWCKFEMPKCGQKIMISKSKGWEILSGPLSIATFQNNFVLQDWRNVLQFASESCYKLRRPTVITKCCNPCYKMRSFHLLQNAATLLQNAQLITKCATYYKMRRYYKMPQHIPL